MQSQPRVSVLTPVYNTDKYLAECIESVLAQTYENWEYVIVNNCSTDRTLEIAENYARQDSRIRIHNNTDFLDIISNHNLAFRLMSPDSEYCKVISADDSLLPDCLTQMVNLAEAHPTVGIVSSYGISTVQLKNVGMPYPESVVRGKDICRRCLLGGPYVFGAPTSLLYRSTLVRSVDAFYPNLSPHADTAACYEFLDRCDFGFVHQILSVERVHTGQTSERSRNFNYYVAENLGYLVTYGPRYLSAEELQNRLRQRLTNYYKFLSRSFLRGMRKEKEFWDYHKGQLEQCGHPFDRLRLTGAVAAEIVDMLLNPKRTLENLLATAFDPQRGG